jgi:hypothetical protein
MPEGQTVDKKNYCLIWWGL